MNQLPGTSYSGPSKQSLIMGSNISINKLLQVLYISDLLYKNIKFVI